MKKVSIIIPSYNEEESLPFLIERLNKLIDSIEVHKRAKNAYMLDEDTKIFETSNPENCMEALDAVLNLSCYKNVKSCR